MKSVIVEVNHARVAAANTPLDYYSEQRVVMIDQNTNISFLKLFQDGQAVEHLIGRMDVKNVAVIGARYIGIEIAEAAIRRGKKVKLFDVVDTS